MSDAVKNGKDENNASKGEEKSPVKPGSVVSEGAPKKNNTPLIIGIIVGVVVVIGIIVACVFFFGPHEDPFYDKDASTGQAPYKTDDEKQAEIDRVVEEGMLSISIMSVINFQNGESEGTAYIENVPSNKYVMKVNIKLKDNDEVVYESGGMKPDTHIDTIKLNKDLPQGTYPAVATFFAYDPDTLEEKGQAAAEITLVVDE